MLCRMRAANRSISLLLLVLTAFASSTLAADDLAPLEAYGALPQVSLVTLSPSGKRVAYRKTDGRDDHIYVYDLTLADIVAVADARQINPRAQRFATENDLILVAGETIKYNGIPGKQYRSSVFNFEIDTQDIDYLLKGEKVYKYQGGIGQIIGRSPEGSHIYMPAWVKSSDSARPTYGIFRISLDNELERVLRRGSDTAIDWFMSEDGKALIREEYKQKPDRHRVWREDSDGDVLLYENFAEIPDDTLAAWSPDRKSLVFIAKPENSNVSQYFLMALEDGEISGPVLDRSDAEIERLFTDINRVAKGVQYSGFMPSYHFIDEELNQRVIDIQESLPGMAARVVAISEDDKTLVMRIEGGSTAGQYLLFDSDGSKPVRIGQSRPSIRADQIADVHIEEYSASDGLTIPALVTAMRDVYEQGSAPLIVMPHGGPESNDVVEFDWLAQYFASRGYIVMQPQFRGSSGFGREFTIAGHGEWGGKMQTDLDDGIAYLVENGKADPERVCMVGASYGGYAALAAGAFSPRKFRCIVSIAGIADLRELLSVQRREAGKHHWTLKYWRDQIGAAQGKRFLRSISPVENAESFSAPVLLVHGKDDTVVPIRQTKLMRKALKKAKKDVTYVELDGEDHWMTQAQTRIEMLRVVAEFVEEHL